MKNFALILLAFGSDRLLFFLLPMFMAILVGIFLVVVIIRSLPFGGGYYPQPMIQPSPIVAPPNTSSRGGSGNGLFWASIILIVVSVVSWTMMNMPQETSASSMQEQPYQPAPPSASAPETENTEKVPESYEERPEQTTKHSTKYLNVNPKSQVSVNMDTFRQALEKPPSGRINVSPSESKEIEFYVIQVMALNSEDAALNEAQLLHVRHNMLIIEDNDGMYKVVVSSFETKEDATDYKKVHELEGFVKLVTLEEDSF